MCKRLTVEDVAGMDSDALSYVRQVSYSNMIGYLVSGVTSFVTAFGLLIFIVSQTDNTVPIWVGLWDLIMVGLTAVAFVLSSKYNRRLFDLDYIESGTARSAAEKMEIAGDMFRKIPELGTMFRGTVLASRPLTKLEYQYIMTRSAEIEEAEVRKKLAERLISTRESLPDK